MNTIEFKKIEDGIVPIYENEIKGKLINARELHKELKNKRKFSDWIKQRIEQYEFVEKSDFIRFHNFVKGDVRGYGNKSITEYYITVDMAKELCMIENNDTGRKIRRYFIETEKRYKTIINNPSNIFDFMRLALNEIEKNENNIPHSNLIGAIARQLGYKTSYKHFYEDDYIAIIKDITKNEYWQVYFKPQAVENMTDWFNQNKEQLYYEIQYVRNTKNGKKGEVKERGYKIEDVCYKIY